MESWSYISRGGEDFVHNESASATDRNENWLMDSNADFMSSSNQEGTKNSQFVELGYYADDRTPQKPIIDLELGRFPPADHKDVQQGNANNNNPNFSSGESSSMIPAKRIRAGKWSNQIPYCQVYGCKKDLSNCKDYHKRHKVCEIHSKTPKVIVNGIDQRFCQQCSRFHLLAEFDEGKRSCRRRLAGHNERRRKPHVGMHSTRSGRFLPPYTGIGTRFNGPSCFAFPSSSVYRDRQPTYKHELNDHHYTNNVAAGGYVPPPPPPPQHGISYHQMCSSNSEAQSSSFLVHNQDFVDDSTSHHPLFRNNDELTILTDSNSSSCALSLLSFQSENQNPPPNKNIPSSSSIRSLCHLTQQSTSAISNVVIREEETQAQMEEEEEEPILISDDKYYGMNEFLLVENTENRARNNGDGGGSTINLLQLSSQLQQVKQEEDEDTWFGLRIT